MASIHLLLRGWHEIAGCAYKLSFWIYENLKSSNWYVGDCYISRRYSNRIKRILGGCKCRYLEWRSVSDLNVQNWSAVLVRYICLRIGIIIHKCKFCLYESVGS